MTITADRSGRSSRVRRNATRFPSFHSAFAVEFGRLTFRVGTTAKVILHVETASGSYSSSELTKPELKRIYEELYGQAQRKVTQGRDGRTWSYRVDNVPPQPLLDRVGEPVPDQFVVSVHLWFGLAQWSDVKKNEWLLDVPEGVTVKDEDDGVASFVIGGKKFVGLKATGWLRKT